MLPEIDSRIRRALANVRQGFRAVLTHVNSRSSVQLVQAKGLADEALQDNEMFQQYGLTSNPPPGSMAIVLPLGGQSSHGVIIATEHAQYRLQSLASGEVALYTDEGAKIVLKRGKLIQVDCEVFQLNCTRMEVNAASEAVFTTPMLTASAQVTAQGQLNGNGGMAIQGGKGATVTGSLSISNNVTTGGDVVAGNISLKSHTHRGDSGGVTGAPQ